MSSYTCLNCNTPVEEHDRFCDACGAYLEGAPASANAPQAVGQPASQPLQPGVQPAPDASNAAAASPWPGASATTVPVASAIPGQYAGDAPATAFGLAIASLVLGCLGILSFGVVFIFGIVGIILGITAIALRSGYQKQGLDDQRAGSTLGMGIAGIITNAVAIIILASTIILGAVMYEESGYTDLIDDYGIEEIIDGIDA